MARFQSYFFIFCLLFMLPAQAQNLTAKAFDWDDTIMFTITKIYIYNKITGEEIAVSTRDFAEVGEFIGKDIPAPKGLSARLSPELRNVDLSKYELRFPDEKFSFRDFRDAPGENAILEKVLETIETRTPQEWMGPSWKTLVAELNDPIKSQLVLIITARGHAKENFYEMMAALRDRGYFKYLPKQEHIFTVGSPEWAHLKLPTEVLKVRAMEGVLDQLQKAAKENNSKGHFVFADDDYQNVEKAIKGLKPNLERWPNIAVKVEYVGYVHPETKFFSETLSPAVHCQKIFAP